MCKTHTNQNPISSIFDLKSSYYRMKSLQVFHLKHMYQSTIYVLYQKLSTKYIDKLRFSRVCIEKQKQLEAINVWI